MNTDIPQRHVRRLMAMTPAQQRAWIRKCRPQDLLVMDAAFEAWAEAGQIAPSSEGWRVWLMMAGRGYGKTRAGAEWVHQLAMMGDKRIALVGATIDEARGIMVEGVSGLIGIARRKRVKIKWEPGLKRLTWPRGSVAELFSGDSPEGLRGPEHDFAWCDELAKWRHPKAAWDNMQMGLRRGVRARALITTTPRPIPLLDSLRRDPWTVETGGRTGDNINLPINFIEVMMTTYGSSRTGRQELLGEYFAEAEGSLFPRVLIERCRTEPPDAFDKIVVGVDPPIKGAAGQGEVHHGDACGIVVAGRSEGKIYVLADCSIEGASPERWARAVAEAAEQWNACVVVAEANQGGAMVESVLKAAETRLPVRLVHASQGKAARAEPVATRFEVGRAFLCGTFVELEAELAGISSGAPYQGPGRSPDRADAMVWAVTELSETRSGVPRIRML
ncbi:MAG: terminase family protein [Pseudomonadota bacterium]|nr:terminase family protein [Pseudomonadota bacterium]